MQPYDAAGCLRVVCDADDDCADAERCYAPGDFGECDVASTLACAPEAGGCVCTESTAAASFCVRAEDYPAAPPTLDCESQCGAEGTHTMLIDGICYCDPGWDWCVPEDPDDFTCCMS